MTSAAAAAVTAESQPRRERPSTLALLLNNRLAAAGLVVLGLVVGAALAAPILPLADPNATDPAHRLAPLFAPAHLLGTDALGRDILSRLIWGTRVSLAVGVSASLIAAVVGSAIGLVAGYAGGRSDQILMRLIDLLMAFPYILLALAIVAILGPGLINALYAIAIVNVPFFARNIRGITVGLARREFIDAARLSGKGPLRILWSEILPNVLPTIVITLSTTVGWMILETAGLSFLGLGAQPPQADLGSMLGDGRKVMFTAPTISLVPGLMIFLIVISINLIGDGIRDALDPRLRSGALARPSFRTAIAEPLDRPTAPLDAAATLDVKGLRTDFRMGPEIYHACGGVDLTIAPGQCLGLVGESGSGKSVTAMSLMGLVPSPPGIVTGGTIGFRGEDLATAKNERIRTLRGSAIAHVFQDPLATLHPLFCVGDQIVEAIRAHQPLSRSEAEGKAEELLTLVRIPNPAERMRALPHELSGGLRQRVSIAMALANDPELIIADEPTTALDVTVQADILRLLDTLRHDRKLAVLFITHDFGVVSEIADRVAVMYAGKIVETGPTTAVLADPAHPYTRMLIDCVPVMGEPERRLDAVRGRPPAVNQLPAGCSFAARCPRVEPDCSTGEIVLDEKRNGLQARCLHPLEPGETLA
ncbi:dipeptide/oligopeptide/nickel ABC transporter permease/ATP-binding protein [Jiella sp. MQZ9-1]|uniref:Dipeptide/oligopeptide/nickel ABC transporter permease/ATP-binding protein n=1 Tax=Jiella flava TaxID=2816857 RepID=A0A939G101_9HYPH|nr:dipeptide/oligopeptide/nickel ABC transporter permease/ATP-binding protein [Jiella flava]MBO0663059.1 dipeptide/oligopeptide/nickel ABC transporter permease/ATP-binding protein [Jiella flava]MCD2471478.1 dipeptide/oligopeptide/nickel ABC transporter permease/ATP-binding protein [Jiella flava]